MKLLRRILYLLNRRNAERDLAEEMAAHREMLPADRRGSFGNALKLREESRDSWGFTWLDQLRQDLAYGARQLRRSPGFTLTAIAVLALGVGLNLSLFQVIEAQFYDRISVRDSASLLQVIRQSPARTQKAFPAGIASFYLKNATQFSYLVTEQAGTVPISLDDDPFTVRAQFVSGNYFAALGVNSAQGRVLGPGDESGVDPVVELGYGYWQRRFGGDPTIVGRTISVNRRAIRVVGITPSDFDGLTPARADLWLPLGLRSSLIETTEPLDDDRRADTALFGVPRPGVSPRGAEAEFQSLAAQMRAQHPETFDEGETVRTQPLGIDERKLGPYTALIPMVLLVLFSSCANLGNMLLARGSMRAREIETRIAVGAGRWRMVRQLMTENLLLATLGSLAGLLVGRTGARLLLALFGSRPNIKIETGWSVVLAAAAFALISTLLFGLTPAIGAARGGLSGKPRRANPRRTLLAIQVTVSCVLLSCAGVLARGAQRLTASGSRLDFESVVLVDPGIDRASLSAAAVRQALNDIAQRISKVSGVEGVTLAGGVPLFGVRVETAPGLPQVFWQSVEPSYFQVMSVPLTRGRNFHPGEPATNIIISESAARFRWPDENPLGKSWGKENEGPTVIGIAADSESTAFRNPSAIEAYTPLQDREIANAVIIARANGDPLPQLPNIRAAAKLPGRIPSVRLLQSQVDSMVEHSGKATDLLSALGSVASLLAGVGIFGLVAFAVTERTREIGLRLALGATPRDILRNVFGQYASPFALGSMAGIVLAFALVRFLGGQIILGIVNFDVVGYGIGVGAFFLIALAAVAIPARRALRIDPATALRWE